MKVVILAGGFGTRLKSVVSSVPKPLAPIMGRPFLNFQMENGGKGRRRFKGWKAEGERRA